MGSTWASSTGAEMADASASAIAEPESRQKAVPAASQRQRGIFHSLLKTTVSVTMVWMNDGATIPFSIVLIFLRDRGGCKAEMRHWRR